MTNAYIAYFVLLSFSFALAAWTMRKHEWSWVGLYVAFGCLFSGLSKQVHWLLTAFYPSYANEPPSPTRLLNWPHSPFWTFVSVLLGLVYWYAMVGALRRPTRVANLLLLPISMFQLSLTAWGIQVLIAQGGPTPFHFGSLTAPAWVGAAIFLLIWDLPFLFAIPFAIGRSVRSESSEFGRIGDRFRFILGLVLVGEMLLAAGIFTATVRTARLVGYESIGSQVFVGLALLALIGLLAITLLAFRRSFLDPAMALLKGASGSVALAETPGIGEHWLPLARMIDESRAAELQATQELRQSQEHLHQSEKLAALGQLLAGVAHELNNPLTVVVGRAAILEEKLAGTENGKAIAGLREAADRCNRIVKTFLAMARQSAPRRGPVNLNRLAEAALDMTAYGMRSAGISVETSFSPDLPEVEGDEDQLIQVFTNLMLNAQHALERLQGERRVRVSSRLETDKVVITVIDNGPGVPEDLTGRIFEPFFTTKDVGEGTGMGLAMSRGMIEEHEGTLAYEAARGGGACFRVTLPVSTRPQIAAAETEPTLPSRNERGRVLVVDDEEAIRTMLVEVLAAIDLECIEAADGAEALECIAREPFDLIICDVRMPVVDGIRFRRELADNHPDLLERLIFTSGDVLQRGGARLAEIERYPFIEKPFNPAEVRAATQAVLRKIGETS